MAHTIEVAKSGRAGCRSCRNPIPKGELRFGEETPSQFGEAGDMQFRWHHMKCAASKLPDFQLGKYQDQYVTKLKRLIELKVAGQEVVQAPDHEEPKILNLMDALKKSVAEAQARLAGVPAAPEADAKLAPSTGKKKGARKVEG